MSDSNALSSTNWYYAQDGNSIGPVPFATLKALHAAGQITDETFVVAEGGENWKPYNELSLATEPTIPPLLPVHPQPLATSVPQKADAKAEEAKKNKQALQGCLGCLGLIVAIVMVTVVFGKCSSSVGYSMQKTPQEKVKFLARQKFGDRLRDVKFTPSWNDRVHIEINFNAKDNLTNDFIRLGIISDMRSILNELFTHDLSAKPSIVVLAAWLPTTNKYGKDGEAEVYRVSLDESEAAKVSWEKAQSLDFTKIWNTILIHPQLRESAE